ncbi:MAG: dihydroneopterin aldolase [Bacteroidales bacterium]|nr:dihydroneopterin aldolase [Bacteroidales bacterium]
MKGTIELNGMHFRAFHGVLEEERRCGGDFVVDFRCGYPFADALRSDHLSDTLDYSAVYALIAKEMAVPSQLLEHVAGRIAAAIRAAYPQMGEAFIRITKLHPPVGGPADAASVSLYF